MISQEKWETQQPWVFIKKIETFKNFRNTDPFKLEISMPDELRQVTLEIKK